MDFPQQLEACVKQANQALSRFISTAAFRTLPWSKPCSMAHY